MSQANYYAGNSIAGASSMSADDAARMLHDLLRSVASIPVQNDDPLPQSPWAATSVDPSNGPFLAPNVQRLAPLDHSLIHTQHPSTFHHPIDGMPCEPSYYAQHAHRSFQTPHAFSHPPWAYQDLPPSTVAPQDTWTSSIPAPETLTAPPSYQGRSAIGMRPLPMQHQPAFGVFATGPMLQTVPPQFEQGRSTQYPHSSFAPPVSHFPPHITSSHSRDGPSGNLVFPPSPSAPGPSYSSAPIISNPPHEATAPQPRGKTIYLPPTYDKLQGETVHQFRVVSVDSATKAARTPTGEKVYYRPVNNKSQVTDLNGRITFYDPHHAMVKPVRFGASLALYEVDEEKREELKRRQKAKKAAKKNGSYIAKAKGQEPELKPYKCRYIDPAAPVKPDKEAECGCLYQTFTNWKRHFLSDHVADEHNAIQRGDLDVSRAVALKHSEAAIQVIECCTCRWRSAVGDRLDMGWIRHLVSEHGLVLEKKEDERPVNKRPRDESDDEPPVNKKPRSESKNRPSVNKTPRRESKGRPSVKKGSRGESSSDTGFHGTLQLEGPPRAKNRRTQKRR